MSVAFTEGETYAQIFDRVMKQAGYEYEANGTVEKDFTLNLIKNADSGKLNVPNCIQNMPASSMWDGSELKAPNNQSSNINAPDLGVDNSSWGGLKGLDLPARESQK